MTYHFSEPGHGKGPHDGVGATSKHGLDRLVVQDKVRLRNAYEVYLAASRHLGDVGRHAEGRQKANTQFSKRVILYVPKKMLGGAPNEPVNAIKDTLKIRYLRSVSYEQVEVANLSCGCPQCLNGAPDGCLYREWRQTTVQSLRTERTEVNTANCILFV